MNIHISRNKNFFFFSLKQKARGAWKHWNELIKGIEIKGQKIREMLVPTVDTARYTYLMSLCVEHARFVVLEFNLIVVLLFIEFIF